MMREINFNEANYDADGEIVLEENIQVYSDFMKACKFIRQSVVGYKIRVYDDKPVYRYVGY
ncbi:hypothetical protein [Bartonella sp. AU18XJBT]|uniref:hypothetical protein n=1 Tax=Bartonella sp. AU18XJBT TaxID=3019089 RepID=UPI002361081F|nr:hypothetical protein [Bartonella sp. AU18XJBT]